MLFQSTFSKIYTGKGTDPGNGKGNSSGPGLSKKKGKVNHSKSNVTLGSYQTSTTDKSSSITTLSVGACVLISGLVLSIYHTRRRRGYKKINQYSAVDNYGTINPITV